MTSKTEHASRPLKHDLHFASKAQEDVLRGDIAVDDPNRLALLISMSVRMVEPAAHLGNDIGGKTDRKDTTRPPERIEHVLGVVALDVFHHDDMGPIDTAEIERLNDVPVAQRDRELCLAEEHGVETLVSSVMWMHPLDGNQLFEPCGALSPSEIHLRHAARGQAPKERIGSEGSRQVWAQHGALDH